MLMVLLMRGCTKSTADATSPWHLHLIKSCLPSFLYKHSGYVVCRSWECKVKTGFHWEGKGRTIIIFCVKTIQIFSPEIEIIVLGLWYYGVCYLYLITIQLVSLAFLFFFCSDRGLTMAVLKHISLAHTWETQSGPASNQNMNSAQTGGVQSHMVTPQMRKFPSFLTPMTFSECCLWASHFLP